MLRNRVSGRGFLRTLQGVPEARAFTVNAFSVQWLLMGYQYAFHTHYKAPACKGAGPGCTSGIVLAIVVVGSPGPAPISSTLLPAGTCMHNVREPQCTVRMRAGPCIRTARPCTTRTMRHGSIAPGHASCFGSRRRHSENTQCDPSVRPHASPLPFP